MVADHSAEAGVVHFQVEEEVCCQWEAAAAADFRKIAAAKYLIQLRSIQVAQQDQEVPPYCLDNLRHTQVQSSRDIHQAAGLQEDRLVLVAKAQRLEELHTHSDHY